MTDLSRTVQVGTEQVSRGYQGLANLHAVNRERKKRAMSGIGESLAELGATIRDYGSWRDAKKAEDETRQVDDAYALGMQTGEPEKALVTLGAVRPTTAAAATLRAKRMAEATEEARLRNAAKRDEAAQFLLNQKREDDLKATKEQRAIEEKRRAALAAATEPVVVRGGPRGVFAASRPPNVGEKLDRLEKTGLFGAELLGPRMQWEAANDRGELAAERESLRREKAENDKRQAQLEETGAQLLAKEMGVDWKPGMSQQDVRLWAQYRDDVANRLNPGPTTHERDDKYDKEHGIGRYAPKPDADARKLAEMDTKKAKEALDDAKAAAKDAITDAEKTTASENVKKAQDAYNAAFDAERKLYRKEPQADGADAEATKQKIKDLLK